jgi:hypothetical protein
MMVLVFTIHNKEIVSLCSREFLWLLYCRQAYQHKQLQTSNILPCLSPLNHTQMTQHKTCSYFILGAKWQIFRHIMGQYSIQTSTSSYNDTMGSEADCVEYLELKTCRCEIVSKNLWNTARFMYYEHKNCHFWLLKQMKINQYTSYSGTMPASTYKCTKSRQAEPRQTVF